MSKDFAWTDELILEFVRFTNRDAPAYQGRYADLEQFKQSKKAKQKLFTTEDGVPKYPMDKCWCVNKDFKSGVHSWSDLPHDLNDLNWDFNQSYYFHDEEKAKEFLRKKKLFTAEEKSEILDQLNKLKSLIENK